jgi:hypothetical protein
MKNHFSISTSMTVSFYLAMSWPSMWGGLQCESASMSILSESNLSHTHGLHVYEECLNRRSYVSCAWNWRHGGPRLWIGNKHGN